MHRELSKILVTGGAGFIGSAFVRKAIGRGYKITVCDKLTYAGYLTRLREVEGKYKFYKVDICDKKKIEQIFNKENPDIVAHFAAETHVDRSIQDASPFIETNVKGTQVLLDIARKYKIRKLIHISSDEVYGQIKKGRFNEDSPLKPNSPYAASKAAADLLIRSYVGTYGFPAIIIRPCNNYGPWQYPEKLIPLAILKILRNEKVPIYADGKNVREWLYVEDCAEGILQILEKSKTGEIYNLGSQEEKPNVETVRAILKILKRSESMLEFVKDRPGHDFRYALNSNKVYRLGWKPKYNFPEALKLTINWNIKYARWWQSLKGKKEFKTHYNRWYGIR